MIEKDMIKMKLHETIEIIGDCGAPTYQITRVIGGWIYLNFFNHLAVFVPQPPDQIFMEKSTDIDLKITKL